MRQLPLVRSSPTSSSAATSNTFRTNPRFHDSLKSKDASHYYLTDDTSVAFTIRPAVSPLPPTLSSTPATSSSSTVFPPRLHPLPTTEKAILSEAQISEMQALRLSNPSWWTRSRLAHKYNVSKFYVAIQGFGESSEARAAERTVRENHENKDEEKRNRYGMKKRIDREVRRRRKEFW
ncbi:MAG: hypothetical protein CYPHOPRED_000750 [Cyphobasidiales sp. Tagirdzhanova-0007]|nr:MAG: hypothetical protein CYPHOPRED_000750 [Cyphobasidiales sp. Tagirdzhanova-0007]